jgi:hypothetical protein
MDIVSRPTSTGPPTDSRSISTSNAVGLGIGFIIGLVGIIGIGYLILRSSSRERPSEPNPTRRNGHYHIPPPVDDLTVIREELFETFLQCLQWIRTTIRSLSTLNRKASHFKRLLRPKVPLGHRRLEWLCVSTLDQIFKKEKSDRVVLLRSVEHYFGATLTTLIQSKLNNCTRSWYRIWSPMLFHRLKSPSKVPTRVRSQVPLRLLTHHNHILSIYYHLSI